MGMVTAPVTREPTSLQQMGGSMTHWVICRNIWGKDFSSTYKMYKIMNGCTFETSDKSDFYIRVINIC